MVYGVSGEIVHFMFFVRNLRLCECPKPMCHFSWFNILLCICINKLTVIDKNRENTAFTWTRHYIRVVKICTKRKMCVQNMYNICRAHSSHIFYIRIVWYVQHSPWKVWRHYYPTTNKTIQNKIDHINTKCVRTGHFEKEKASQLNIIHITCSFNVMFHSAPKTAQYYKLLHWKTSLSWVVAWLVTCYKCP